ncbi:unnamed protein product [Prorocentrum cordatum]|uniref:Uncharacterized protein n=1 Tax=Prorocentrum cordatum TaxID=2364126 RepID=A0ABN9Q0F9_9DINO|nr:unnamed protein product [Polarella glacialis]
MPALKPATLRPTLNSAHAAAALVPNAPQQTKPAPRQTRGELCDRGGACPGGRGALPEACLNKRRGDRWAPADFSVDLYYRLDVCGGRRCGGHAPTSARAPEAQRRPEALACPADAPLRAALASTTCCPRTRVER